MSSDRKDIKIACYAPSGPVDSELFGQGLNIIKNECPSIKIIQKYYHRQREKAPTLPHLFGMDEEQAMFFQEMLSDNEIDFIWGIRGGYGLLRWIEKISLPYKGSMPKIIGFSDLTFLHSAVSSMKGLSIHGPLISTLTATSEQSRLALWKSIESGVFPEIQGTSLYSGKARGHLFGGNLTCLVHSLGTPFEPEWEGGILLIEDHNEPIYKIDRMLTQLILSKRLSRVSGIVSGSFFASPSENRRLHMLLKDRLSALNIPVIADIPAGHFKDNYPLLLGAEYLINGDKGTLMIS